MACRRNQSSVFPGSDWSQHLPHRSHHSVQQVRVITVRNLLLSRSQLFSLGFPLLVCWQLIQNVMSTNTANCLSTFKLKSTSSSQKSSFAATVSNHHYSESRYPTVKPISKPPDTLPPFFSLFPLPKAPIHRAFPENNQEIFIVRFPRHTSISRSEYLPSLFRERAKKALGSWSTTGSPCLKGKGVEKEKGVLNYEKSSGKTDMPWYDMIWYDTHSYLHRSLKIRTSTSHPEDMYESYHLHDFVKEVW